MPPPTPADPLPQGRHAGSTCRPEPSSGAEPRPTRWSPVSHLPWLSGPRRAPAALAPTVGAPSLLQLLDLLQAQPRALVDAEVAQHLLHRLCVRVLHGCGGPAGLTSCPRGFLASASHSGRGLVSPRAPRRGLASPPPPPPPAASARPGAESPRAPTPRITAPLAARLSPAPDLGSAVRGGGGSADLPPLLRREGLLRRQPSARSAGRGSRALSPLS